MKTLEELAAALTEVAKLPEAVQKARQEQFGNIQTIEATLQNIANESEQLRKRLEAVEYLSHHVNQPVTDPYTFVLTDDNPDRAWREIIQRGQEIQQPFWEEGEERWNRELGPSPKGVGWYGTVSMPIITILATEPEYKFQNTARLPGRFNLRSASRWGSALRFDGSGDAVQKDTIPYGHCYNEPIGIYVEPATIAPTGMTARPFEQDIRDCLIVGTNRTIPIYVAQNPDRLHIVGNNIQHHSGGFFGIKHGPAYEAGWMPKLARSNDAVYLGDSNISGNQFEAKHRMKTREGSRKFAEVFFSGQYVRVQDNTFYGCPQCIYSHGGGGRVVTGNTAAHGDTADGRQWAVKDELVLATICQDGKASDSVGMNAGGFKSLTPSKRSTVTETAGWHNAGEAFL